jgi:Uma2 family endonuclease
MGVTSRLSIDEYMSYQAPPGFRDELIEGEIVLSPEPKPLHADVAKQLEAILTAAVQGTSFIVRQRINFLLQEEESMPSPDLFVMDKPRWNEAKASNQYPVDSPQLAIEIQSPSDTRPRLRKKIELYLRNGSFAVWVVYPLKKTVVVFTDADETEYRMGEHIPLPKLLAESTIAVDKIFEAEI